MTSLRVIKLTAVVPVTREQLTDHVDLYAAMRSHQNATPEQREQWAREAEVRRADERAAAGPVFALTIEAVLDKLGWSQEYAEHFVQPYCGCGDGMDGWETCQHARDEGVSR